VTESLRDRKKLQTRRAISDAALELMVERGYAATTMGDIADAADVSRRTVFRYFADKEDVVFADDAEHLAAIVAALDAAEPDAPPLELMRLAGHAFGDSLFTRRKQLQAWVQLVGSEPALQARSLAKQRAWEDVMAARVADRSGVDPARATLVAKVGVACVQAAFDAWVAAPRGPGFGERVDEAFAELRRLA
jgi:AcrR family transcriptional regulator